MRADLDGKNIELLISNPDIKRPGGFTIDTLNNFMYWTDVSLGTISRADLDGNNIEVLVNGLNNPSGLTINYASSKIYWTDYGTDKIQRADLDGMNVEDIVAMNLSNPIEVAVYYKGSKIYWTESGNGTINRCDFDGANVENIITTDVPATNRPNSIFIDEENEKIYYSIEPSGKQIGRADVDGSNKEEIVGQNRLKTPRDLFLINKEIIIPTKEIQSSYSVNAFPNPFSNDLTFESEQFISKVFLYNSNGSLVYSKNNIKDQKLTINTSAFPNGLYCGVLFFENEVQTIKLIKAN
ncbi:MAG: DUF5050 domain-containing protein [Saprospiraceae bacterium]